MSGHTPGPWFLEEPDGDFVEVSARTHRALARVVWQMEDDRLCNEPSPTQNANARLIASAPDLLAVANLIVDVAERVGPNLIRQGPIYIAAKAAIAKATGEAQ